MGGEVALVVVGGVVNGSAVAEVLAVQLVQHPIQASIEADLKLLQQYFLRHLVYANILRVSPRQNARPVGRVADRREVPRRRVVVRRLPIVVLPPPRNVPPAVDLPHQSPVLDVPEAKQAPDGTGAQLLAVGTERHANDVGAVLQRFDLGIGLVHIPKFHGPVPGPGGEGPAVRMERQGRDGSPVAREHVQYPTRPQVPDADLEGVGRAGRDDLPGGVGGQGHELARPRRRQGLEVAVSVQVVRPDRTVQARAQYHAGIRERHGRDRSRVIRHGAIAKAAGGIPQLQRSVLSARHRRGAVRAVRQASHAVPVSPLLDDVGLGPPLPDQKLTGRGTSEGQPLPRGVDGHGPYVGVGDGEGVHVGARRELVKPKQAGGEADDEEVLTGGVGGGGDDGVVLVEVVTGRDGPGAPDQVVRLGFNGGGGAESDRRGGPERICGRPTAAEEIDRGVRKRRHASSSSPCTRTRYAAPPVLPLLVVVLALPRHRRAVGADAVNPPQPSVRFRAFEVRAHHRAPVAAQRRGDVIPHGLDAPNPRGRIVRARHQDGRVRAPPHRDDVAAEARVGPVKRQGGRFPPQPRRPPNLNVPPVRHGQVRAAGTELGAPDPPLEFEPMQHHPPPVIRDDRVIVHVDHEQYPVVGT
mmetsp:Transcript_26792/g.54838  ORF Transcript_26792/g.54838 Transcript_26792/m.54838 type:complete len:639 (-) Transcript_26792:209-2125(-)